MLDAVANFFRSKRRVAVLLFRDDRTIGYFKLPVEDRYIVDEKNSQAWGLRSSLLLSYKGKPCEAVIEHDCAPISLNSEKWDPEFGAIADEAYTKQLMRVEKEGLKARGYNFFLMIGLLLTVCLVFVVLAGMVKSGSLSLPSFGG